ncbi:hypothetical protein RUA8715_02943 [Ruegeria arenilitoris]|uniref:Uncharacterized protein n=1 Tax=Ruegeria arenilitoris TaxID=1173585 RepID=A0A238KWD9_9RHOB|nr:hypothetical protein RUA8715_02943 [Ruegeria arenilitoris]
MTGEFLDTVLNVTVFLYLGFLIWLCLRPDP